MRQKLFGHDIAKIVADKLGPSLPSGTLHRVERVQGTNPTAIPASSETSYPCRLVLLAYRAREMELTHIERGDRKAMILAGTLPDAVDPRVGDFVTAEGRRWRVIDVERDPATAAFVCQVRD